MRSAFTAQGLVLSLTHHRQEEPMHSTRVPPRAPETHDDRSVAGSLAETQATTRSAVRVDDARAPAGVRGTGCVGRGQSRCGVRRAAEAILTPVRTFHL